MALWFDEVTGLPEPVWLERRAESIIVSVSPVDGEKKLGPHLLVRNVASGRSRDAGAFRIWSLDDLEAAVSASGDGTASTSAAPPVFEIITRLTRAALPAVEVSAMQAVAVPGTLFQVASNFNALEVPSRVRPPEADSFVTDLMFDSTQGPAASSGCGVAAITRAHAAFYNAAAPPHSWGQTLTRQVELLGDEALRPHFPVVNGKLYAVRSGTSGATVAAGGAGSVAPAAVPPFPEDDDGGGTAARRALLGRVCAGLHAGVRADYVRAETDCSAAAVAAAAAAGLPPPLHGCVRVAAPPTIDQVFVAALSVHAAGVADLSREQILSRMRFLLRAAYHLTYACAALRSAPVLVLTCVGGGVFGNPLPEVAAAIAHAHRAWAPRCPALTRVVLPLFSARPDVAPFVSALRCVGVAALVTVADGAPRGVPWP